MKTLPVATAYGYQELRFFYKRYMTRAMSISISLFLTCMSVYHFIIQQTQVDKDNDTSSKDTIVVDPRWWQPPIDSNRNVGFSLKVAGLFDRGTPVPVPDMNVDLEKDFPTQKEINKELDDGSFKGNGFGDGGNIIIPPDAFDPKPDTFIAFEQEPRIVLNPHPEYPDLPRRAGIEGYVYLKVLISTEGKVKNALVLKSSDEMFEQSAMEAAKKWIFTPALMNGKPVAVWISIPFRFRLNER